MFFCFAFAVLLVCLLNAQSYSIPFFSIYNLILIKATVEEKEGFFILDTGAHGLIINEHHFDDGNNYDHVRSMIDFNQRFETAKARTVRINLDAFKSKACQAIVIDLQHLKIAQTCPVLGLIPLDFFKDYEIVLDFKKSTIFLFETNNIGQWVDEQSTAQAPSLVVPLKMKGHLPYLDISVGQHELKMGLDTGSELALLRPKTEALIAHHLDYLQKTTLRFVGKKKEVTALSKMYNTKCSFLVFNAFHVVTSDLGHFNNLVSGPDLDGILGNEFLCQFLMGFNLKSKELHIWLNEKEELIVRSPSGLTADDNN